MALWSGHERHPRWAITFFCIFFFFQPYWSSPGQLSSMYPEFCDCINPLTFQLLLVSNHQLFLWSNFSCRCCCSTQRRPCWACAFWRPTVKNSSHLLNTLHIIILLSKFKSATLASWAHFGQDEAFENIQFYLSFSTLEKTLVSRIKERNSWAGFSTAAIQTAQLKTGSSIFGADQQFWRIFSLFGGRDWPLGYSGQNWKTQTQTINNPIPVGTAGVVHR